MKTIQFHGIDLTVTPEMKFISLDENGTISGYPDLPELVEDQEGDSFWCDGETSAPYAFIMILDKGTFTEEQWRREPMVVE